MISGEFYKHTSPLFYKLQEEMICSSILPTATQYARNALFAGELPVQIKRLYPNLWKDDTDPGGKNQHEQEYAKRSAGCIRKGYIL